jgi:hypothetical protein
MKNLFNIAWKAAITLVAFAGFQVAASAQIQQKEVFMDFPDGFTAVNISNEFDVSLVQGDVCSITVTIDEPLSPYLSVRCQGKTLFVSFEEKSVTKEVKKLYSGRNAPKPSFHAVIAMPAVESITICDKVVLNSPSRFEAGIDKFELTVLDEAQVKLLSLSANNAKVNLQKKANVSLNINTENNIEAITEGDSNLNLSSGAGGELIVNASGKSKVSVKNTSNKVNVAIAGNAQVSIASNCNDVIVNAEGSSKLTLTGMGADISVKASKSANVDAYGLQMTEAVIDIAGNAQVSVNASETIEISSTGGKLLFAGSPVFKIVKVSKASILPYGAGE